MVSPQRETLKPMVRNSQGMVPLGTVTKITPAVGRH
jgi:hypothetical protein